MKKIQTTCNYCTVGCGLEFYVEDNQIKQILPKEGYPVNPNLLCIKGLNLDKQHTVYKPSPLPKIRQEDGSMKEVAWDQAYEHVASKIQEIQAKYGPEAFAGLSTGQLLIEDYALLGHLMRDHLQTNLDGNTRLCMATAVVAHKQSFGFDSPGYTIKDIELSDTIVFIGSNPVVAHPVIWSRVRASRKPSDNIIVIDPRKSHVAKEADYHYGIKHDGDLPLLYTVANLLIERDALDHDFISQHTNHFEEFKEFVKDFTLDKAEEPTGLSKEEIIQLADLIESGQRVSFWWCMGVNQHYEGVRVAQAIINLALMTGNIGKPGTGANSLTGQPNAMGSRLFSNTTSLPGGANFDNQSERERIAGIYGVEPDYLAKKPTIPYNAIVEGINSGEIKGLWVYCTNPRHSFTNNETFRQAAEKLELLVVQDIYDDTETAELATVMLPVVPAIKKEGTMINTERRVGPVQPVISREANEKTDYEVFLGIGQALGMNLDKWQTPRDAFELMKETSRGTPCDITGIDWDQLKNSEGVQWPLPEGQALEADERRLYEDGQFFTPDGRANFVFETPMEDPMATSEEFPIVFNTGRISAAAWHTRTRTREIPAARQVEPDDAYVIMGPGLAQEKKLQAGDQIRVHSSNGQSAIFDVQISADQRDDEIFAPLHYEECNKMTLSIYDPYSKEPAYKSAPVNIEKIEKLVEA
ncbi:molybdopterin oxidoreductase family protein [Hutsoniella sourekii]|uniref:molybdopterin oxidoreductase family protein n=1 Tax=Hutsoniella sourekii TaxID=87650 RepID=UPI000484FF96|nr:molybdopterin oxidoreductase family protein [Hutsoniella sourekii]